MGRFYNFLSIKVKIIVSTWTYLSNAIAIVINIEAVNANCVKGYRRCGKSTVCISVAMSNTSPFLKLSRMEPNKYRESKQAITTSRRLNAFLISFLVQRIYEAKKFPTIPRMATIHWATPSIKKDTVSSNSFSSFPYCGQYKPVSDILVELSSMTACLYAISLVSLDRENQKSLRRKNTYHTTSTLTFDAVEGDWSWHSTNSCLLV